MVVPADEPTRVALIGYGAIARILISYLHLHDRLQQRVRVVGVLVREARVQETEAALMAENTRAAAQAAMSAATGAAAQGLAAAAEAATASATLSAFSRSCSVVSSVAALLSLKPTLVVECAGQGAVEEYTEQLLAGGVDVMIVSTGALADDNVRGRLTAAAEASSARMLLPAGAIAGLDGLGALRVGGLESVRYTSTKPPSAWRGTPAEQAFDLAALSQRTVVFSGPAAQAARAYPKNANLAATVALAGLGMQRTEVTLVADPACSNNTGRIDARGAHGTLVVECCNQPAADNPKTSANTGLSLAYELLRRSASIVI